jgi:hypothetical protein
MHLTDDQIRDVLARAEEIRNASLRSGAMRADMEGVIEAGEAVGLPRAAIEKALREELDLPARPSAAGDLVFARSTDDKYYVASVVSPGAEEVRVRFLRGGDHAVTPDDIRPCTFLPGEKVVVNWPWWGAWTGPVVSYDAARQEVTVTDGWDQKTFPIAEVWLDRKKRPVSMNAGRRARTLQRMLGVAVGAGGLIGSLITWMLLR